MAATARPRWVAVRRCMTDISSSSVVSTRLWTPGRGAPWATASTLRSMRWRPSPLRRRTDGVRIGATRLVIHAASPPGGASHLSPVGCDQRRSVIRGLGDLWIIQAARICMDGVSGEEGTRSGGRVTKPARPETDAPPTGAERTARQCAVTAPTPARRASTSVFAKAAPAQPKPSRLWLGGSGRWPRARGQDGGVASPTGCQSALVFPPRRATPNRPSKADRQR